MSKPSFSRQEARFTGKFDDFRIFFFRFLKQFLLSISNATCQEVAAIWLWRLRLKSIGIPSGQDRGDVQLFIMRVFFANIFRPGSARAGGGGGVMGSSTGDLDSPTSGAGKNVFHRLVAGTTIGESSRLPDKGRINPFQGRIAPKSPLICTHVAEGHTKAVLSVFATDELLLSASKDR